MGREGETNNELRKQQETAVHKLFLSIAALQSQNNPNYFLYLFVRSDPLGEEIFSVSKLFSLNPSESKLFALAFAATTRFLIQKDISSIGKQLDKMQQSTFLLLNQEMNTSIQMRGKEYQNAFNSSINAGVSLAQHFHTQVKNNCYDNSVRQLTDIFVSTTQSLISQRPQKKV